MAEAKQKEHYTFSFYIHSELASLTHLRLFNGYNEVVHKGFGSIQNLQLPQGLYRLRIELNEHVEDRNYRLTKNIEDSIGEFETATAMPIQGRSSTHTYFSEPTRHWSKIPTVENDKSLESSLFLFFRYADIEQQYASTGSEPLLWQHFVILNSNRQIYQRLNWKNTRSVMGKTEDWEGSKGEYFATCAFHASLPCGQYYLCYEGEKGREIPLYVFNGWQTQFFLMFRKEPVFCTARISIGKRSFEPEDSETSVIDALLQKMHNGIYYLPPDIRDMAASGKWKSPMLGIIACYIYLLSSEVKDDAIVDEMQRNLRTRILKDVNAPDLVAIELLSALHRRRTVQNFNHISNVFAPTAQASVHASQDANKISDMVPLPELMLTAPCMVAAGMRAYLEYAQQFPDKDVTSDLVDEVFVHRKLDTVWTSYEPLGYLSISHEETRARKQRVKSSRSRKIGKSISARSTPQQKQLKNMAKVQLSEGDDNWIANSILVTLAQTEKLNVDELASNLQLTPGIVKHYLDQLATGRMIDHYTNKLFANDSALKSGILSAVTDKIMNYKSKIEG